MQLSIGTNLRDIDAGFAIIQKFPTLRQLPVILSESDPESCAACDATSHPENSYRLSSQYASYEAELLNGTLALAQRHHINIEGSIAWAFTFPGQPIFAGLRAFTTHDIDLPVLNLFRMLGQMKGERVAAESTGALTVDDILQSSVRAKSDVNVIATRGEHRVNVLVWNFHDKVSGDKLSEDKLSEDKLGEVKLSEAAAPEIHVRVEGLPKGVRQMLLEHWRVDRDHSNSYTAWQKMGSPQNPSADQYRSLKAAGQLQLLESPRWVPAEGGAIELTFAEPALGVSALDLTW